MATDLTVLGVDPVRWAERWGIEPFSHPCNTCGAVRTASIPFVRGTLRGLYSPPCACGDRSWTPYCMVRDYRVGDLFDGTLAE
jgi:hypothetical protein